MWSAPAGSGNGPSAGNLCTVSVAPRASNASATKPASSSSWWRTTVTRMGPSIAGHCRGSRSVPNCIVMTSVVDLCDLDLWARGVPYAEFATLRRQSPVVWCEEAAPNSGFWSVLRYADIVAASRDAAVFSSARGVSFEEPTDEDMAARRTIIDTDPPGHTKLRKIVSGSFTQRAVAVYRHFVAGLTEEVLDSALAGRAGR